MPQPLQVFYGPFEALEEGFVSRIGELQNQHHAPVLVVTPSLMMSQRLERLLVVEHKMALTNVYFHTFHSLADQIVTQSGPYPGELVLDALFHDTIVDSVLDQAPLLGIAGELRPRALSTSVRSSLRDLLEAGVDAKQIAAHFEDEWIKDKHQRQHLIGLLSLLAAYEKKLESLNIMSPSNLIKEASRLAFNSKWLSGFKDIIYYGFYDLNGLQIEAFEAVTSGRTSKLYFPYRKNHAAFRFADEFFEQNLIRLTPVELKCSTKVQTALGPVLDGLFDSRVPVGKVSGQMKVISASGARDEVWAAAKEAARLIDEGYAPEDIAIIARSLEPYRAQLVETFDAERIPLNINAGEPLLRQPFTKAVLDLLTLRQRDFPAQVVLDLCSSPYFIKASAEQVSQWRQLIGLTGISAGWMQWRGKFESKASLTMDLSSFDHEERLKNAISVDDTETFWKFITNVHNILGKPSAPWSMRAQEARTLLIDHLALPLPALASEVDAYNTVMMALDDLSNFDRLEEKCSWDRFLDIFERKLQSTTRSMNAGHIGVRALDVMDARGHRFKATILIGLKEKSFPRQISEDPILRDSVRAALKHPAGYHIARKMDGHEEERLLFYLSVSSAREQLILIYPRSNDSGRAEVTSSYLQELCRAAGYHSLSKLKHERIPRPPAERLAQQSPSLRTLCETLLYCALSQTDIPKSLKKMEDSAQQLSDKFEMIVELNRLGPTGTYDGTISSLAPEKQVWERTGLSPTALDDFAQCHFKFFASRVLGLDKAKKISERGQLSADVRGKIYHEALERFYRQLPQHYWSGPQSIQQPLSLTLNELFKEYDWRRLGLYPVVWEATREQMSRSLFDFISWDFARLREEGYRPRYFEMKVAGKPFADVSKSISWKGVVDRVDMDDKGHFQVVDYKTRENTHWKKGLSTLTSTGESHQIPVYLELLQQHFGNSPIFNAGHLLYIESDEKLRRVSTMTQKDWHDISSSFSRLLESQIESILEGHFSIIPDEGEGGHCSWCDFSQMCRKSHGPTRTRAKIAEEKVKN